MRPNTDAGLTRRELFQSASLVCLAGCAASAAPGRKPVVLNYVPDWHSIDPATIDYGLYTHLCHAFAHFEGGALHLPDETASRALIDAAHAHGVKVLLSIGGADSNTSMRAQDPAVFSKLIADRVRSLGYDGVDLDWEGPENAAEGAQIATMAQALRTELPKKLLTMAMPAEDYYGKWFDVPTFLKCVDWWNVMIYDYSGPWSDKASHNAPFSAFKDSFAYWRGRGWPADRFVAGFPGYGKKIRAKAFGEPTDKSAYVEQEVAYNDVHDLVSAGWVRKYDSAAGAAYLVNAAGTEIITYEDPVTARAKGAYARSHGMRGIFFWEITHDFDGKTNTLVREAKRGWDSPTG